MRTNSIIRGLALVSAFGLPAVGAFNELPNTSFRDDFDIFSAVMISPLTVVFPLVVTFLVCSGTYQEVGNRYISTLRVRRGVRSFVGAKFARASVLSFATFFVVIGAVFLLAFVVWPAVGNPEIDPAGYHLTARSALIDSYSRDSYSFLLRSGALVFASVYATWVGLNAAAYAALGIASLLLIPHRVIAFAVPFLVYFGLTIVAALIGLPHLGPAYSVFPFGLQASSWQLSAAPSAIVIVLALGLALFTTVRSRTLVYLT